MRRLLVLVLLTCAVGVAADAESARKPPRSVQDKLLQEALRGFAPTPLTGRAGPPTRDWAVNRHHSFRRSTWLNFKVRAGTSAEQARQQWQADVVTGLLAGVSKSRGWRPVTGRSIVLVFPDGSQRFDSGSVVGSAFRGGIDHVQPMEAEREIRLAAAEVGATIESIRLPQPLGRLAIEVIASTDRPRDFATRGLPRLAAIADPVRRRAEGVYVEVRTADGRLVAALGGALRTSSGISVVSSEFR